MSVDESYDLIRINTTLSVINSIQNPAVNRTVAEEICRLILCKEGVIHLKNAISVAVFAGVKPAVAFSAP